MDAFRRRDRKCSESGNGGGWRLNARVVVSESFMGEDGVGATWTCVCDGKVEAPGRQGRQGIERQGHDLCVKCCIYTSLPP